jgi:hypothetical protein
MRQKTNIALKNIPVLANIEIAWRPGQKNGTTSLTVASVDATINGIEKLGSVNAKVDGSIEIQIGESFDSGWTFRLNVSELWRIANEAMRIAKPETKNSGVKHTNSRKKNRIDHKKLES